VVENKAEECGLHLSTDLTDEKTIMVFSFAFKLHALGAYSGCV